MHTRQFRLFLLALPLLLLSLSSVVLAAEVQQTTLRVDNLTCTACLANIEAALQAVPGALGMTGNLQQGTVTVDHAAPATAEQVAAAITAAGYPATVTNNRAIAESEVTPFGTGNRGTGGCGGCGGPSRAGASSLWKQVAPDSPVLRTTMTVNNLSCISCLANIEAKLREVPGTIGMQSDLRRKQVIVLHEPALAADRIAESITNLGYPATVTTSESGIAGDFATAAPIDNQAPVPQTGWRCAGVRNQTPCTATASSWRQFYSKFFGWLDR